MGIRFRKSIKIAPGVRLSATTRGLGLRVGPRGAGLSITPSGSRVSAGIPGTGLYWSERLGGSRRRSPSRSGGSGRSSTAAPQVHELELLIRVDDETGDVTLLDAQTEMPLDAATLRTVKRQQGSELTARLEAMADGINETREHLTQLHYGMPPPVPPLFTATRYDEPVPAREGRPPKTFMHNIWPPAARRREATINARDAAYMEAVREWKERRIAHDGEQERCRHRIEAARNGDLASMEVVMTEMLQGLEWPHETLVAWEFRSPHQLMLDVDFPEVEMLPARRASVPARGLKISLRKLAAKDLDALYAQHVHSIGMRLAAYCFSQFPTLDNLTLSGFSQRVDKGTGHENDDYLYSVRIPRQPWELLNFAATQAIDAYAGLGEFEIRRNVLASWKMKAIEPFKN